MKRIEVTNLTKKFKRAVNRDGALNHLLTMVSFKESQKEFTILKDLNFSADAGEIVGIVGKNGSGKTTLLRMIGRIYLPDWGHISTRGKIIPLINLNIGFQPRLSMAENIYLCGALFGLDREEIRRKFHSIVSFSGLEDYISSKIYQFSNGMLQRLAFSIAIHSNPDILLLDEFFESTDHTFKKKCQSAIKVLSKRGTTILIVSHDFKFIRKLCKRMINIEK